MGYQFKLEALRRYRQFQEEAIQKEFSEAIKIKELIVNEMNKKRIRRADIEKDLKMQQRDNQTAAKIALYERYLRKINEEIQLEGRKVVEAEKMCDEKRQKLMNAMKKRKAIEKIKEKDFEKYLATLEHKEAKFINEIALNRFALNQK